ncbi:organic solute transporter subunit alpha-like [Pipra filicauda]|uniref:Organic solute transporter subunit alpha-like n=1 Tax=Pipra filicauda TaxID=649802 RepID=A0A6J2H7Z8_9PASS|nr:organic solute transporter subunit alpha-like [Pipra filicauda]
MDGEANGTLDPSCGASEPPYSEELLRSLDLPGRFLFATLTLMTLIAILVFIEEAVYIYRKIPSSKRSIIIWINAAAPVISTTSCIGMWIPRSTMFTDFTAGIFFAIVIHKFLMMMIKECGGQKLLLRRFEKSHFTISTGPCCCCCLCLPRVPITRQTLFWLKVGTFQFAVFRPVLVFLSIVLWSNDNYLLDNLSPKEPALWINIFMGVLTLTALWAVGIVFRKVRTLLTCKNIIPKFALYQFIVVLNHLQTVIIRMLATQRIIPCAPPLSSTARASYIAQQLLIMEMFLITVISRVIYRRKYHDLEPLECTDEEARDKKQTSKIILNGAVVEDGLPKFCNKPSCSAVAGSSAQESVYSCTTNSHCPCQNNF